MEQLLENQEGSDRRLSGEDRLRLAGENRFTGQGSFKIQTPCVQDNVDDDVVVGSINYSPYIESASSSVGGAGGTTQIQKSGSMLLFSRVT